MCCNEGLDPPTELGSLLDPPPPPSLSIFDELCYCAKRYRSVVKVVQTLRAERSGELRSVSFLSKDYAATLS